MEKRDILNYEGIKIGNLELPVGTSEEVWAEKLSTYLIPPLSPQEIQSSMLKQTIKQRKEYAENMLERFKKRNIENGINGLKSQWLHHRMRALEVNFMGVPMVLDILNMAVSGDIETACIALLHSVPDDGTLPQHFYTEDVRQWLISDMKNYLGWV
jgi:hypothetical protein